MSAQTASQFPTFPGADVHLIITGSRQYHLHSTILREVSPVLRALLTNDTAAQLNKKTLKKGLSTRWRLVLVEVPCEPDDPQPQDSEELPEGVKRVLQSIPLNEEGKATTTEGATLVGLDLENGVAVPNWVLAYHTVFGAFYNIPIDFGPFMFSEHHAHSLTEILETAMAIVDAAEALACTHVILKPIEATLLSQGQLFHQSMARSPIPWLNFADRIQSHPIYREALIHSVGQYQSPAVMEQLPLLQSQVVQQLLRKKAMDLRENVKLAEMRILSYYPTNMQREKTIGRADKDSIGRASYANDIMSWMALVVLRHFITQNLAQDQTHNAPDMGWEFVQLILDGGDNYLAKPDLAQFHTFFPMSQKGCGVLEFRLGELKDYIRKFVAHFVRNESQLDIASYPIRHFTCTVVEERDYPEWAGKVGGGRGEEDVDEEEGSEEDEEGDDEEMEVDEGEGEGEGEGEEVLGEDSDEEE
jgi:hypothetical protein